jgi:hypothetical protein
MTIKKQEIIFNKDKSNEVAVTAEVIDGVLTLTSNASRSDRAKYNAFSSAVHDAVYSASGKTTRPTYNLDSDELSGHAKCTVNNQLSTEYETIVNKMVELSAKKEMAVRC